MKRKNALISLYTLLFVLILSSLLFANSKSSINFSQSELVFSQERDFVRVELSDSPSLTQVGAPELPQKGISLIIPQDVKVKGVKVLSYEKEALVGEFYVYPIQKKVPIGYTLAPFIEPDPQIIMFFLIIQNLKTANMSLRSGSSRMRSQGSTV